MKKRHPLFLDKNENLYGPSPSVYKFILSINKEVFSYYSRDSINVITESISKYMGYDKDKIIISYGGEDLLWQIANYIYRQGEKTLLISEHSWWYYRIIAEKVGLKIETYETVRKENEWSIDVKILEKKLQNYLGQYILLCSPNNPTGEKFSKNELETILNKFKEKYFILDEAYWGFDWDESNKIENYNIFLDQHPNLIILRTFSKFFALAGVRIGFALFGNLWKKFNEANYRYLGYNKFSEEIVKRTLKSFKYYKRIAKRISNDRDTTFNLLKNFNSYIPYKSYTNFLLIKINDENVKELLKKTLLKRKITIKWFSDDSELKDHIRITIGKTIQMRRLWHILIKTALEYEKEKRNIPIISKFLKRQQG